MISGETAFREPTGPNFPTHFNVEMSEEDRKKFTPWKLEKSLQDQIGSRQVSIRCKGRFRNKLLVEVKDRQSSEKMKSLSTIDGHRVTVTESVGINTVKALIYINEYDMSNFEAYK